MTESIQELLGAEHARLERTLERLRDAVEGADRPALVKEWDSFERVLQAHLDEEEALIFPALEESLPEAVRQAREAHGRIRRQLDELGLEVQLHSVRFARVDEFLRELRAHRRAEDEILYPAADIHLAESERAKVLRRVLEARA